MLYASTVIIILLSSLYLISLRHSKDILSGIDRKKHGLYFLYPSAQLILKRSGLEKKLLNKTELRRKIQALYTSEQHDSQIKFYCYKKISLILLIFFLFSCVSMITSLQEATRKAQGYEGNLTRPEEGGGDNNIRMQFRMKNDQDRDDIYEDEIIIRNKERQYTDKEWEKVLDKAIPYLEQEMLGENKNHESLHNNLNLIRSIPGTGIVIEWIPKDYRLISSSGKLMNEDITSGGIDTLITAVLKHQGRRTEHTIPLTIRPVLLDKKALLYKELRRALDIRENETVTDKQWRLPGRIGKYSLEWQEPEDNLAFSILIIGLVGSIILWILMDRSLDDKMKLRNNQMLVDYPEIINKFNLLVNAGMTIRQAWIKIAEDYKNKSSLRKGHKRYAYEEMLVTLHELKLGIPEVNAYEQFGIRSGLMPFMKFSSMLVQNLKKGNKNMIEILKQEAKEAFHERKENTKKLGEEASTKLLGPMILMLIIVLIIILIPAYVTFQI